MKLTLLIMLLSATIVSAAEPDKGWVRIQLDERFRSEGVAAADLNSDGQIDVVAGDVWYQAPAAGSSDYLDGSTWKRHEVRKPGEFVAGVGYSNSFVNVAHDVDRDGWTDVVIVGFPGDPFHWYRNPGAKSDSHWQEHLIWTSICNESPEFEDLDGDGVSEFIFGSQPESQMGFVPLPDEPPAGKAWSFHAFGHQGDPHANGTFKYYHGLGVGDVNGDGHKDVLICHGWWESPGDLTSDAPWKFHPIRVPMGDGLQPLPAAANLYTDDFDSDGDADLFLTSAHQYGVWWCENRGDDNWRLHEIDKSFSQTHAVERVDVNGDGQLDYVTGKRFFAHNGNDPGGKDEVTMHWFEVKRTAGEQPQFINHEIVAGKDTGIGTQFEIEDVNKDGRPDIVLSNKKGVNVLLQK
jgi:hypothetical protein